MLNKRTLGLGETRSVIRELYEYGKQLAAERGAENVFDFSIGNPNAPAPDCVIKSIEENLKNPDVHGYTSAQGDAGVRKKIAAYIRGKNGLEIDADDIYVTCGAAAALTIVFTAINCEKGNFVVPAPYFPEYKVFAETAGGTLREAKTNDDFSLNVGNIAALVDKDTVAVIINSPNNPVGNVYTRGELEALAELLTAKEAEYGHPVYLVSDEPYREIVYGCEVPDPTLIYDDTIVCYSFSKTLSLAGERIGYIAVSPKAKERREVYSSVLGAGRALGYVCAPSLFQYVMADCIGKTANVEIYRHNRELLTGMLKKLGFEFVRPDGAFYLFAKCPVEAEKFFEICKEEGVLVVPSESFGTPGWVRIAYCVSTDLIERSAPHFEKIARRCGLVK